MLFIRSIELGLAKNGEVRIKRKLRIPIPRNNVLMIFFLKKVCRKSISFNADVYLSDF